MGTIGNIHGQKTGVQSVNGIKPDPSGNIALDPDTWEALKKWSIDLTYPVGSIYCSTTSANPATLFGYGRWELIKDKFLLGSGSHSVGDTGGEATTSITVQNLPPHKHTAGAGWNFSTNKPLDGLLTARYGITVSPDETHATIATEKNRGDVSDAPFTSSVGDGEPINNMPPYLVVSMWKRVE